jgi:hypothetical protein
VCSVYRKGLAVVPKAGERAVVTKTAAKAAARTAVKRQITVLQSPPRRAETAAAIRAAVEAGHFGPAGSKPRLAALATARLLEKDPKPQGANNG